MDGELKLKPDDVPMLIMLKDIQPVGHYALRLIWSDGHDTGLYALGKLRQMCQCTVCQPNPAADKNTSRRLL